MQVTHVLERPSSIEQLFVNVAEGNSLYLPGPPSGIAISPYVSPALFLRPSNKVVKLLAEH